MVREGKFRDSVTKTNLEQGWDNNGNNKAPAPGANVTVEVGDDSYQSWLSGKPYIARKP